MTLSRIAVVLLAGSLSGCSSSDTATATPAIEVPPGETPVTLSGQFSFASELSQRSGTARQSSSFNHAFSARCEFTQPAVTWTDPDTGTPQFRLVETEPGVITSQANGAARATGDASALDLDHDPKLSESSTVRLGGPVTHCQIRRLDPAQFGQGYDLEFEFQVALSGTVQTTTITDEVSTSRPEGGRALPHEVDGVPSQPDGLYGLVNDPGNTGMHLHASPLLLRPALGTRPEGSGPEIQLQQQVYDDLVAQPQTAWIGLQFDARQRLWRFAGTRVTGSGAKHTLSLTVQALAAPN